MDSESLGDAIRAELEKRSQTQKALAQFLQRKEATVSLWLSGRQGPRLSDRRTVALLAKFLRRPAADVKRLITRREEGGARRPRTTPRHVSNEAELERILRADAPHLFEYAIALNTETTVESVQEKLQENRLFVPRDVVIKALKAWVGEKGSGEERRWARSDTVIVRTHDSMPVLRQTGGEIGASDLLPAFRNASRREEWVREAVRQTCRHLDEWFGNAPGHELPRAEVLAEAETIFHSVERDAGRDLARAVLEGFVSLKLLEPCGDDTLRQRWPLNSEYFLNSIFGIPTLIGDLDFLLDGGLLLPTRTGLTLLIQGGVGVGKTTLALQLAASVASQGGLSVYLTAEENVNLLVNRLLYAGYERLTEELASRTLRRNNLELTLLTATHLGTEGGSIKTSKSLVVVPVQNRWDFSGGALWARLYQLLAEMRRRNAMMCCTFDPVDALLPSKERRIFEALALLVKSSEGIGIYVSEDASSPARARWANLADMVITLGYRERIGQSKERVLEIEKSRSQSHIRGQHPFSIHSSSGISVYPSVQALLSVWRRRVRREHAAEAEEWEVGESLNLGRLLRGDLVKGSPVLVTGPPGTHKIPLGLSFLASGLQKSPDSCVLLVSLREDVSAILRIVQTYPQFDCLLDRKTGRLSPKLKLMHFPPDYFTAERFLHWMRRGLREAALEHGMVSRVMFSSVSQLLHNSPMFAHEPLFVDALAELFRKETITSLFIDVGGERTKEIQNVFDIVISTTLDFSGSDPDQVRLQVGHSGLGNADRGVKLLRRVAEESGKPCARLILMDFSANATPPLAESD